jgi:hypothetical protein
MLILLVACLCACVHSGGLDIVDAWGRLMGQYIDYPSVCLQPSGKGQTRQACGWSG